MRRLTAYRSGKIDLNYFRPPTSMILDVGMILSFSEMKLRVIAKDDSLYIPSNYLFSLVYREPRNIPGCDDLYEHFIHEHTRNITHSDIVITEFDELVSEMDTMFTAIMTGHFGDGVSPHIDHYCFMKWISDSYVLLHYK